MNDKRRVLIDMPDAELFTMDERFHIGRALAGNETAAELIGEEREEHFESQR